MSQSFLRELPKLVEDNIIDEATASNIRSYYEKSKAKPGHTLTTVLGILGALLAGSGIILLIAHNWDSLNRVTKTILAFVPILLGQALCFYSVYSKKGNRAWGEASAVILFFGVGSCISLIGQIYHIDGSLENFLLTWSLLCIPLVYLIPSSIVSLCYIASISWYACEHSYFTYPYKTAYLFIPLLLLVVPNYISYLRNKPRSNFFHFQSWFLAVSVVICLGTQSNGKSNDANLISLAFLGLFGCMYYIGKTRLFLDQNIFANPYSIIGTLGILITLLMWSFNYMWNDSRTSSIISGKDPMFYLTLLFLATIFYFNYKDYQENKFSNFDPTGVSAFAFLLAEIVGGVIGIFIVNAWILLLGIYFVRRGAARNHLGILNFGLLIIAALAICRFFDDTIPFLWRGFFFLATGAAFFIANYLLIRKRKLIQK